MVAAHGTRKLALVTGAAQRIGAVIARHLHAAGFDLALHYRHSGAAMAALRDELESVRQGSTIALQAELGEVDALTRMITQTTAHFGRLDALVNNASTYYATPLGAIDAASFDELMAVNARAPLLLAQAAAPALRDSCGAIVNIIDIYAERPLPRHAAYCASKAALAMATRALALELGPQVRVNGVAPGNILWSTNPEKAETLDMVEARTALGRQGRPEDIAEAVRYLIEARYTTGVILAVDGGRLLHI